MVKLLEVGRNNGLHELVLDKIESILLKNVRRSLSLMGNKLAEIEASLAE